MVIGGFTYLHATSYLAFNVLCHNLASDNAFYFKFLQDVNNNWKKLVAKFGVILCLLSLFGGIGPWVCYLNFHRGPGTC